MIKILRESPYNRAMLVSFILIFICNIVSSLLLDETIKQVVGTVFTIVSIPLSLLTVLYPQLKKDNNKKNYEIIPTNSHFVGLINCDEIKENKQMLLKRKQHRKNIIKKIEEIFEVHCKAKGLILTGESGAGKSILLRFLANDLKAQGYNVTFNCIYNSSKGFPKQFKQSKKNIFIFDQFEESLKFDTIERWINKHYDELKNCVFVFSFPQKFLTGIYNKLYQKNKDFYLQSYVLYLNKEDEKDYLEKITAISGLDERVIRKIWKNKKFDKKGKYVEERTTAMTYLLERELNNVKTGIAPLIEMEFLGEMVERYAGSNIVITDGNFINYYFDRWVEKFDRKETAYAILTFFTRFEECSLTDIKLMTFEDSSKYNSDESGEILYLLLNSSFLNSKCGSKDRMKQADYKFAPQHEYVSRAIQKYLADKEIPLGVKCYVEHYRENSERPNYVTKVQKHYDEYTKKHTMFNIFFCSIVAVLLMFNIYNMFISTNSADLIFHRIFITPVNFTSIFYIYNYCAKIMWVKGRVSAIISSLIGVVTVVLSYIFPDLWGVFFGGEIIVFSFCIRISMVRQLVEKAHKNLMKDFWIFLSIGITISALGVIFWLFFVSVKEMTCQQVILRYSYYVLFFIYAFISNINHIRYSYISNKIGYSNMLV